jgi:uncharacterized small protein (DUF1192 family)
MDDSYFSKCCELEARLELSNQKAWQAEQRVLQLQEEVNQLKAELNEITLDRKI